MNPPPRPFLLRLPPPHDVRSYLTQLPRYDYPSLFELLRDLLATSTPSDRALHLALLEVLAAHSAPCPTPELLDALDAVRAPEIDRERVLYRLLHAVQTGRLLVVIDGRRIPVGGRSVRLQPDSSITFVEKTRIDAITFKTL